MGFFDRINPFTIGGPQPTIKTIDSQPEAMATKASRAAAAVHDSTTQGSFYSEPLGTGDLGLREDENYETLLRKYAQSAWCYVSVNRICNAVSQVNFRVIDKRKKGQADDGVSKGQGLVDLLGSPNPHMSSVDFFETIVQHLLLTGNCYIEKAEINAFNRPKELYILNPKNMSVVPHKTKFVGGYKYIVNKKIINFKPNEIIHLKLPDPRGESHYGLATLAAARSVIDADWSAREWNNSYFKNATWPSGIIVSNEPISETEFKRMKRELKSNYEGKSKVGKVLVLEGGLDWKQTTPNPKDLDFLNLLRFAREEILAIFGVPPSIAGIYQFESTSAKSAGVREQTVQFWSGTVQPVVIRILSTINKELVEGFSKNYEVVPDVSDIPALKDTADIQQAKSEAFNSLINSGWSVNQALGELYPNQEPVEWGDIPLPSLGLNGETVEPEVPSEPSAEEVPEVDTDESTEESS